MFTVFDTSEIKRLKVADLLKEPSKGIRPVCEKSDDPVSDFYKHSETLAGYSARETVIKSEVRVTKELFDDKFDKIPNLLYCFIAYERIVKQSVPKISRDEPEWTRVVIDQVFEPLVSASLVSHDSFYSFSLLYGVISYHDPSSSFGFKNNEQVTMKLLEDALLLAREGKLANSSKYLHLIIPKNKSFFNDEYSEWIRVRNQLFDDDKAILKRHETLESVLMNSPVAQIKDTDEKHVLREIIFQTKSNHSNCHPVDIFVLSRCSMEIPFIHLVESPYVSASRSWFEPSIEFYSTYFTSALSSEMSGKTPCYGKASFPKSVMKSSVNKGKGPIKIFDCSKIIMDINNISSVESNSDVSEIISNLVPTTTEINSIKYPNTFIIRINKNKEGEPFEYITAYIIPCKDEETDDFPKRYVVSIDSTINDDDISNIISPKIQSMFDATLRLSNDSSSFSVKKIKGAFNLENVTDLKLFGFYFNVITNPVFSSFLYVNEIQLSYAQRVTIPFFNIGSPDTAAVTLTDLSSDSDRSFSQMSFKFDVLKYSPRTNILPIIYQVESETQMIMVKEYIGKLLGLYIKEFESSTDDLLKLVVPDANLNIRLLHLETKEKITGASFEVEETMESTGATPKTKIKSIRELSSVGSLTKKYVTECSCSKQPVIVSPDELEDWNKEKRKAIEYNGRYYVCPSKKTPYPSANKSKLGGNFPCCFKREETAIKKSSDEKGAQSKVRADYSISRNTPIEPTRFGILSETFLRIFKSINVIKKQNIVRFGNKLNTPNSLLHALMLAFKTSKQRPVFTNNRYEFTEIPHNLTLYDDYPDYTDPAGQENYVNRFRSMLINDLNIEVYSQEFPSELRPSLTLREAVELSLKPNLPIDSYIHHRGIEELFQIRLAVIKPDLSSEIGEYFVEYPRSVPINFERIVDVNRPTIILFKLDGFGDFPHYEVIGSRGIIQNSDKPTKGRVPKVLNNTSFFMFPNDTGTAMSLISKFSNESIRIRYEENKGVMYRSIEFLFNYNDVTEEDYFFKKECSAVSQLIDFYGKTRGLEIKYPGLKYNLFVIGEPGAPLNLPSSDQTVVNKILLPYSNPDVDFDVPDIFTTNMKIRKHNPYVEVTSNVTNVTFRVYKVDLDSDRKSVHSCFEVWVNRKRISYIIFQFVMWARIVDRVRSSLLGEHLSSNIDRWWSEFISPGENENLNVSPSYIPFLLPKITETELKANKKLCLHKIRESWPLLCTSHGNDIKFSIPRKEFKDKLYRFMVKFESETYGIERELSNPMTIIPRFMLGMHYRKSELNPISNCYAKQCLGQIDFLSEDDICSFVFQSIYQLNDWILFLKRPKNNLVLVEGSNEFTPDNIFSLAGGNSNVTLMNLSSVPLQIGNGSIGLLENLTPDDVVEELPNAYITSQRKLVLKDNDNHKVILDYVYKNGENKNSFSPRAIIKIFKELNPLF